MSGSITLAELIPLLQKIQDTQLGNTQAAGKSLPDIGDIVIDNCASMDDALVSVYGVPGKVAASSTVTSIGIAQTLVAETTETLWALGKLPERVFVSPNVTSVPKNNNRMDFQDYEKFIQGCRCFAVNLQNALRV